MSDTEFEEDNMLCSDQPSTKDIMDLLFTIKKDTTHTKKTLESTNETLNNYIDSTNSKFEGVTKELNKNSAQIKSLNDKIKNCESLANSVNFTMELQKQKNLRNNVTIYGVPHRENENLNEIVGSIVKLLSIEVMVNEIQACYRVKGKFSIIVVKFSNYHQIV